MNEPPSAPQAGPINPSGEKPPGDLPQPSAATVAAGNAALDAHFEESSAGKRQRGRPPIHGRYIGEKRNRGKIPVEKVVNGAGPLLLDDEPAAAAEFEPAVIPPAFDEKVNREMAGVIVSMFHRVNLFLKHGKLEKKISRELADFVVERKTEIPPEPRAGMETGLVLLAKKHNIDLTKTPEGLFFLAVATWKLEDVAGDKRLIAEYFRLRPQEVKP
jgi:hypothetical protein